ncbi:MAG: 3-carboxy-cis,cis-muconate cycloisomerase [Phyllobacteriaceae bacterium]|nr:3-carboxy-cis,cis-muconate cycloisomerase [Phyllobacteriaceae bacterium]
MTLLSALAGDDETEALLTDAAQVKAMLAVEAALARASADVGWIVSAAADAVSDAVSRFEPDWAGLKEGMARDGVVIPALVRQLRALVAEEHRAALHKGATSQDIIDTALMLQLVPIIDLFENRIGDLCARLDHLAREWTDNPLMAHTRMQVALPTTWNAKLASWSDPLRRHLTTLTGMRRRLLVVQLGGPVGDRASFDGHGDAIAAHMARQLDLGIATPWQTGRDPIVEFASLLALISGTLGKMGADIALLAQNEVAAIKLEGGGGSSAMAHKANPVRAEVLVALARANAGLAGTMQQAMVHEYERSGAAWTLEWLTLPQMLINTGASLRLGMELLGQIREG